MNSSPIFESTGKMSDALSSAVFIDRDGTIMEDTDYCSHPKDVRIFPGVLEALRRLKSRGFKLIIITNQSGIGRGLFTLDQYRAVESEVLRQLGEGLVDAKEVDVECAHNAGVRAIRVRTGIQRDVTGSNADWVADDVPAAIRISLDAKS